jgi:putative FmdB family regulatory protein
MPIYEYTCQKCSSEFELLIRNGQRPKCPSCGAMKLEKRFSVPAAPAKSGQSLPICEAPGGGGCGLPQCGGGNCGM